MNFEEIVKGLPVKVLKSSGDREISSVEFDSRKVKEGSLFIAVKGFTVDGHDFVKSAVEKGCAAILVDSSRDHLSSEELLAMTSGMDIAVAEIEDTRHAMALVASAFYGHPADKLDCVGVTGTKGKTTTTFMIYSILKHAGRIPGLIGTVFNIAGDKRSESHHTTPESVELYSMIGEMADLDSDSLVMEVSSLGLKFDRVCGLRFDVACFTNLYEDHIGGNEHPDMEDYADSKIRIFDSAENAVVNLDGNIPERGIAKAKACPKVFTISLKEDADVTAYDIRHETRDGRPGSAFMLRSPWYEGEVFVGLPGLFNVYNALFAISAAGILGVSLENVRGALEKVFVPGRVQPIPNKLGISVLVDYAHNAVALESVIKAMRDVCEGRIITLFGCGGNRAKSRRYEMGEVSGKLSDLTVITSDNPRDEEPMAIIEDILTGMNKTDGEYITIPDRREAIGEAIRRAKPGDIVLIAGKGHENYQIFGKETRHFDDAEEAKKVIAELEGV